MKKAKTPPKRDRRLLLSIEKIRVLAPQQLEKAGGGHCHVTCGYDSEQIN